MMMQPRASTSGTSSGRAHTSRKPKQPIEGLFCNYSHRICMQNRLDGFDYCIKHILEDKNSPFKQCNYISQSCGKRCPNATSKADKRIDGYCPEHANKVSIMKHRALRKRKPKETPETLLDEMDHYGPRDGNGNNGTDLKRLRSVESVASKALEYATSSDSEAEPLLVDQAWRGDGDSDAESIDSEQEDPLKHAGVYTAEEVALITRDKLIRLQSLYIDQFKRLQHLLKEKRRRFLHTARGERDKLGSIAYAKEDPEQRPKYDALQSMKRYHRRQGKEALLHRQSKERRIQISEGISYKPPSYPKCIHTDLGMRCSQRTVPLAKYCKDHIYEDRHQVLFKACDFADGECKNLVPYLNNDHRCTYHTEIDEFKHRLPVKRQSSEEKEECGEAVDVTTVDVKLELTGDSTSSGSKQVPLVSSEEPPTVSTAEVPPDNSGVPIVSPSSRHQQQENSQNITSEAKT